MNLTVGILEDKLRKYPKETAIQTSCGVCHHGALGNETIVEIVDETNQTFGYIELRLNASSEPEAKLATDKEEFYKAEIKRLNEMLSKQKLKSARYEESILSIRRSTEIAFKQGGC